MFQISCHSVDIEDPEADGDALDGPLTVLYDQTLFHNEHIRPLFHLYEFLKIEKDLMLRNQQSLFLNKEY